MRLEGQSKLGYYPTPDQTLELLLTWLSTPEPGLRRYLDPCCGKGQALAAIASAHTPAETYGIELSDLRAAEARQALLHVINTGYEYAVLTDETFSLVLLNPPYDGENETGGGTRMEETFLINTTSRLAADGVLATQATVRKPIRPRNSSENRVTRSAMDEASDCDGQDGAAEDGHGVRQRAASAQTPDLGAPDACEEGGGTGGDRAQTTAAKGEVE